MVRGSHREIISVISNEYKALGQSAARAAEDLVKRYASETKQEAAATAPVDTGLLASSYVETFDNQFGQVEAGVTNNVRYAYFMEFGFTHWRSGKRVPPQPSLTPAFLSRIQKFIMEARDLI